MLFYKCIFILTYFKRNRYGAVINLWMVIFARFMVRKMLSYCCYYYHNYIIIIINIFIYAMCSKRSL